MSFFDISAAQNQWIIESLNFCHTEHRLLTRKNTGLKKVVENEPIKLGVDSIFLYLIVQSASYVISQC